MFLPRLIRALPSLLVLLLFSTLADARIQSPAQQRRLASILAQKPMHTTALLAGAAATPMPAMPTVALRSRVMNRQTVLTQEDLIAGERDPDALRERLKEVELRELKI